VWDIPGIFDHMEICIWQSLPGFGADFEGYGVIFTPPDEQDGA
jgi:hypothetical protein